jgi:hypothetical protein
LQAEDSESTTGDFIVADQMLPDTVKDGSEGKSVNRVRKNEVFGAAITE